MRAVSWFLGVIFVLTIVISFGCKSRPGVKNNKIEKKQEFDLSKIKKLDDPRYDILQKRIMNNPQDANAYAQLGYLYGIKGELTSELYYYTKALDIRPDFKEVLYNMACIYSAQGEKEKAIQSLEKAIVGGFKSLEIIESDKDLNGIRNEKRYKDLIQKYFSRQ